MGLVASVCIAEPETPVQDESQSYVPPLDSLLLLVSSGVHGSMTFRSHPRAVGPRVGVSVQEEPELRLCITDDGRGFDPELRQSVGRAGLSGMRQRVGRLGGDPRISSRPGRGTEVLVVLR